jgi:hypothetical protein
MDKKLAFRLLMVPLLLLAFYSAGFPLESLIIIGALFVFLVLLRGRIWKVADKAIERYFPFSKTWPNWTQKALLLIFFILFYIVLKSIIYFALGLVGIDLTEMILTSIETGQS